MKNHAMKFLSLFVLMVMLVLIVGCNSTPMIGTGNWVFSSASVAELTKEADLIVHVTIEKRKDQKMTTDIPVYEKDGVTIKSYDKSQHPFTGYKAKVVELYKGQHKGNSLDLLQNGGLFSDFGPDQTVELGNPLLDVGKSYVLFLDDVSGDKVLAPGKTLYMPINPASIYQINGNQIAITAHENEYQEEQVASLPTTLADLKQAIVSQK